MDFAVALTTLPLATPRLSVGQSASFILDAGNAHGESEKPSISANLLLYSRQSMGLIIRSSAIHAAGCYTTEPIAKGTHIVEYTGQRITKDEADRRYKDSIVTYLFGLGDGTNVIDGHGVAMFVNHSCDANCETDETGGRVWIKAIRNIAAGEELVYDYNLYDGDEDPATCNCGAKTCRGSMYSVDELKKRARTARASGKNGAVRRGKKVR
jgi:hypothetical protein